MGAISPDGTIWYWSGSNVVERFDTTTGLVLSPLVTITPTSGLFVAGLLCLADGSVVVLWIQALSPFVNVARYSAAGALVRTYTMPLDPFSGNEPRANLSRATDDPTSFWASTASDKQVNNSAGQEVLRRFVTATGTIQTDLTLDQAKGQFYAPMFPLTLAAQPTTVTYPVRRLRRFMLPWNPNNYRLTISRVEVILQPGIGLSSGQGSDPIIMLRLSPDGGVTWGPERQVSAGKQGEYQKRVFLTRWKSCRNPVMEMTCSDPVNWQYISFTADITEGSS